MTSVIVFFIIYYAANFDSISLFLHFPEFKTQPENHCPCLFTAPPTYSQVTVASFSFSTT